MVIMIEMDSYDYWFQMENKLCNNKTYNKCDVNNLLPQMNLWVVVQTFKDAEAPVADKLTFVEI